MPFAGYKDFDDCVRRNKDKEDPKAYCGELMHRTEKDVHIIAKADITKIDEDHRLVFGWANVAMHESGEQIEDKHGDLIDPEDLEVAAYTFVLKFRELNTNHQGPTTGVLVESLMATPQKLEKMGLAPDALPTGWWVGFYVQDDAAWEGVKKGEFKMFSIEGWATREAV